MDFISYLVFMIVGGTLGAFFGWLVMRRIWSTKSDDKTWLGVLLTFVFAMFGASR